MTELYELELPTKDTPNFTYETSLDGSEFRVNFKYSTRETAWYISLNDLAGNLLLSNARIVPWLDLLIPYVDPTLPKGIITLFPISTDYPQSPVITLDNLSTDFQLFYLSIE